MHVCLLTNSLARAGAETQLARLVAATAEADVDYTVCYVEPDHALAAEFRRHDAELVCLDSSKFDPRVCLSLSRVVRNADVVHAHLPYAQVLGRLVGSAVGVDAIVSTQHTVPETCHPVTRRLERLTRPLDDVTVAVSSGVRASFGAADSPSWRTIHNGIDVDEIRARIDQFDPDGVEPSTDGPRFVNVGRCVQAKAQDVLLAAMEQVVDERPDAHLYVLGDGPLLERLRTRVARRGLEANVTLPGHVDPIEPYYAWADAFVLSSRREGLPVTLLEAMAAGLPPVVTDIPGVREVVRDAPVVTPEDPTALAEAMLSLSSPDRRSEVGTAALSRVRESFSIDAFADAHLSLYRELVDPRQPS